jgi:hypothetical protein
MLAGAAAGQVREPGETLSAGEGAGTLSDISTPLRNPSLSVHDGSQTIGESSEGSVRSGPVRDGSTRSMLSGPVSEVSQGPMRRPQPSLSGGSQTEASAGAVKHDIASPLGERISQPLRELGPLQEQMRQRREQAQQAALTAAAAPQAAPPVGANVELQGAVPPDAAQPLGENGPHGNSGHAAVEQPDDQAVGLGDEGSGSEHAADEEPGLE